jgi:hypothetical protein
MRHVDVKDKLLELGRKTPDWPAIVRLGMLTKLRARPDGSFSQPNFESGLLLQALVHRFRPRRILEIGTGRGFSALCMARALCEVGGEGRILTIDARGFSEPQPWAIDAGDGPCVRSLSLKQVWETHVEPQVLSRIHHVCGSSMSVLAELLRRRDAAPQFVYVDGDHTWSVVRHDVYAALLLAEHPFRILLDDYQPGSDLYGVRRVVDEELEPLFELEAIHTDGRWHGGVHAELSLERSESAQVLLDSERARAPFEAERAARIVRAHRRWRRLIDFKEGLLQGLRRRSAE